VRAVTGLGFSRVDFRLGSGPYPAGRRDASTRLFKNISELGRPVAAVAANLARTRPVAWKDGDVWTTSGPGIRVTGVRISNRTVSGVVSNSMTSSMTGTSVSGARGNAAAAHLRNEGGKVFQ
jgi:hypothetical protein